MSYVLDIYLILNKIYINYIFILSIASTQYSFQTALHISLVPARQWQGQEWITDYKMVSIFRHQGSVYDTNTCYSVDNLGQRTRNAIVERSCSM